jgi:phospholipid/cholesterol/gamma-HCH transport system permease protein
MAAVADTARLRAPLRAAVRIGNRSANGVRGFAQWLLGFCVPVMYHAFWTVLIRGKYRKVVLAQLSDITIGIGGVVVGIGMLTVIAAMSLFAGAQVGLQGFTGLSQIGAEQFTGIAAAFASVREITPVIAAAAVAAQMGTSFTAEVGAMRISDEIDAIEVMSVPARTYLISTRMVATLLAIIPLYLVSLWASFTAARVITVHFFGLSPGVYDFYFELFLPPIDMLYSLIKVIVFTILIVLIHSYHGFYAYGGPVGVGLAVGRAVRQSFMTIVSANLFLSYVFWGSGSPVSITG